MRPLRRGIKMATAMVCAVLMLISATPLSALAPRSRIAKAEKPLASPFQMDAFGLLSVSSFEIAHITGVSPEIVMAVLLSFPLHEREHEALLREILYLIYSGILPRDELNKLKGMPLEQVIHMLFQAAMHTLLTDPWSVSFVENTIAAKPFNAQNIFEHPSLRSFPLEAQVASVRSLQLMATWTTWTSWSRWHCSSLILS